MITCYNICKTLYFYFILCYTQISLVLIVFTQILDTSLWSFLPVSVFISSLSLSLCYISVSTAEFETKGNAEKWLPISRDLWVQSGTFYLPFYFKILCHFPATLESYVQDTTGINLAKAKPPERVCSSSLSITVKVIIELSLE